MFIPDSRVGEGLCYVVNVLGCFKIAGGKRRKWYNWGERRNRDLRENSLTSVFLDPIQNIVTAKVA